MVNDRRQLNQLRGMENKTPRQIQREQYLMRKQGVPQQSQGGMQAGGPGGMEPRFSQPFQPPQGWAQPNFANDKGFTMERGMGGGLPTEYGPMNGAYGQGLEKSFGAQPPQFMQPRQMKNIDPGMTMSPEQFQQMNDRLNGMGGQGTAYPGGAQSLQAPGAVELEQSPQRLTAPNLNYQNSQGSQMRMQPERGVPAPGRLTAPNRNYRNSQGSRQGRGLMAVKPPRV